MNFAIVIVSRRHCTLRSVTQTRHELELFSAFCCWPCCDDLQINLMTSHQFDDITMLPKGLNMCYLWLWSVRLLRVHYIVIISSNVSFLVTSRVSERGNIFGSVHVCVCVCVCVCVSVCVFVCLHSAGWTIRPTDLKLGTFYPIDSREVRCRHTGVFILRQIVVTPIFSWVVVIIIYIFCERHFKVKGSGQIYLSSKL